MLVKEHGLFSMGFGAQDDGPGSLSGWGFHGLNFLQAPKEGEPGFSFQLARFEAETDKGVIS